MTVWHIDPITIECEWTDEYYNMMIRNYSHRITAENEAQNADTKPESTDISDTELNMDFGNQGASAYPHPIPPQE